MPRKTGASHAMAALIGVLLAGALIEYLRPLVPGVVGPLERAASKLALWLHATAGITVEPRIFVPACVASVFGFLWGICYHYKRLGRDRG